jgi:hypothetical protein
LSNEKTAFVPRDSVIFYGISLKFMISQSSVGTIISHGRSTVGYYSIPRSRATREHHALKQYGVRELLFVLISYRTTEDLLSKPKISTRMLHSTIQRILAQIFYGENVKNSGIDKKLKIVFA